MVMVMDSLKVRCTFKTSGDLTTTGPSSSVSRSSPAVWGPKSNNWPLLKCEPKLSCSVGPKGNLPQSNQLLKPALQARRLCHALVLQVRIAQGEELVGGTRHQVHEDHEVARLRQSSLAAVAPARQHRADAVVVRLQKGAPLECPGNSSSEEASSSAETRSR